MALNAIGRAIQLLVGPGQRARRDLGVDHKGGRSEEHQGRKDGQQKITRPDDEAGHASTPQIFPVSAAGFHQNCKQPLGH